MCRRRGMPFYRRFRPSVRGNNQLFMSIRHDVDRSKEAFCEISLCVFIVKFQWQWERTYLAPHNPAKTTSLVPTFHAIRAAPLQPEVQGEGAKPQCLSRQDWGNFAPCFGSFPPSPPATREYQQTSASPEQAFNGGPPGLDAMVEAVGTGTYVLVDSRIHLSRSVVP